MYVLVFVRCTFYSTWLPFSLVRQDFRFGLVVVVVVVVVAVAVAVAAAAALAVGAAVAPAAAAPVAVLVVVLILILTGFDSTLRQFSGVLLDLVVVAPEVLLLLAALLALVVAQLNRLDPCVDSTLLLFSNHDDDSNYGDSDYRHHRDFHADLHTDNRLYRTVERLPQPQMDKKKARGPQPLPLTFVVAALLVMIERPEETSFFAFSLWSWRATLR